MWRDTKRILFIFALGLGTGGYLAYAYEEDILRYADRGYCAQRDVAKTRFWYNCLDGAVAIELQQREAERSMQREAALVEKPDPIADLIRASEHVTSKKKVRK